MYAVSQIYQTDHHIFRNGKPMGAYHKSDLSFETSIGRVLRPNRRNWLTTHTLIAVAFWNELEYHNANGCINSDNDSPTSRINVITLRSVTSEFTGLQCILYSVRRRLVFCGLVWLGSLGDGTFATASWYSRFSVLGDGISRPGKLHAFSSFRLMVHVVRHNASTNRSDHCCICCSIIGHKYIYSRTWWVSVVFFHIRNNVVFSFFTHFCHYR